MGLAPSCLGPRLLYATVMICDLKVETETDASQRQLFALPLSLIAYHSFDCGYGNCSATP